jgi:hypothetical protein
MTVIVVGNFVKNGRVFRLNVLIVVHFLYRVHRINPCNKNCRVIVQIK